MFQIRLLTRGRIVFLRRLYQTFAAAERAARPHVLAGDAVRIVRLTPLIPTEAPRRKH